MITCRSVSWDMSIMGIEYVVGCVRSSAGLLQSTANVTKQNGEIIDFDLLLLSRGLDLFPTL